MKKAKDKAVSKKRNFEWVPYVVLYVFFAVFYASFQRSAISYQRSAVSRDVSTIPMNLKNGLLMRLSN